MRQWIWKALCEVVLHQAYSNIYLKDHLQKLPKKDQALASRIFYGTLQNYAYCQAAWQPFVNRKVPAKIGVLLTFSCYQLLFLDKVPAYAVIDEAVALAKKTSPALGSFVNAVLRKVKDSPVALPEDELERAALQASLPLWIVKMWDSQYGRQKALELAASTTAILPVYVRINPMKMNTAQLNKAIKEGLLSPDESGLYRYGGTTLFEDPLFLAGKISAMDPGSYAIACLADPLADMKVLDICAAPGTKTMAMAELMGDEGSVTSLDLHEHRVGLIEKDARRLGLESVHPMQADSTLIEADPVYDVVLCDVPCSGYGVLARKPDMKLHMKPEDMDTLIPLQKKLLEKGAKCVRPEGALVYSTCTLNKKENEKQVESFLKDHPEFELESMKTLFSTPASDGFFMARLKRKA